MNRNIDHYVENNDGSEVLDFHTDWYCPSCSETCQSVNTVVTGKRIRQMPLHFCPGLFGLLAPMIRKGVVGKFRVNYREDYVGSNLITADSRGKVVMSITTERNDGEDLLTHSPCAIINAKD